MDIPVIAKACGYKHVFVAKTEMEVLKDLTEMKGLEGPVLLEICVKIDSRENLGRPTTSPIENKNDFMNYLKNG